VVPRGWLGVHSLSIGLPFRPNFKSIISSNGNRRSFSEAIVEKDQPRQMVRIGGIRSDGTTPRWYKTVEVGSDGHGKYILLADKRTLKTFKENDVVLPTERLAHALASEWMLQDNFVKPIALPLTRIATAAIDTIPEDRKLVINSLVDTLQYDSMCLRDKETPTIDRFLNKKLEPINAWIQKHFGYPLNTTFPFQPMDHPPELIENIRKYISELDAMHLAALEQLVVVSKSLALSLAISHSIVTIKECMKIARIEEEFQIERWGEVEGAHDLDRADLHVKMAAGALFWRLLLPHPPSQK